MSCFFPQKKKNGRIGTAEKSAAVDSVPTTSASTPFAHTTSSTTVGSGDACSSATPSTSPRKKPLAPMTDTLSSMIEEFKRCTNNLALPGQKKRLQNVHVDMVIAIEEQCLKDGYSVHEKARVAHSLADYCGIQKNSLYARCIKRRDEHKNGAPNLAFLAKSSGGGFGGFTALNKSVASTPALDNVKPSTSTPSVNASKPASTPSTAHVTATSAKTPTVSLKAFSASSQVFLQSFFSYWYFCISASGFIAAKALELI
ncbi:unnamed protein product [Strongylus vulgaris]|uniref:Uncharacterized protein n=1 Tax=Strongylus vulgaris TaxID=40348 RepID=A0A3P7KUB9_STRVU|nr:unnamed protein product [Strongylus vulgaris]